MEKASFIYRRMLLFDDIGKLGLLSSPYILPATRFTQITLARGLPEVGNFFHGSGRSYLDVIVRSALRSGCLRSSCSEQSRIKYIAGQPAGGLHSSSCLGDNPPIVERNGGETTRFGPK